MSNKKWIYVDGGKTTDLTGQKYNRLTFVSFVKKRGTNAIWRLICDCKKATIIEASASHVKRGDTKSCGCLTSERAKQMGHNSKIDMSDIDTGWWVIDHNVVPKSGANASLYYWCHCTRCNKVSKWVNGRYLRDGDSTSCGCYHRDVLRQVCRNRKLDMTTVDTGYWKIDYTIEPRTFKLRNDLHYWCHCTSCNITTRWVSGSRMKLGLSKSCGCLCPKYRKKYKTPSNFNPAACRIIDEYGSQNGYSFRHAMNGGEANILNYYVDGYDPVNNIIMEVDEANHFRKGRLKKSDIRRQRRIMRYLGCIFIRVRVDNFSNIIGEPRIYLPTEIPEIYPNHGIVSMV